ncbi:MAG: DNA primase [Chitinophagaceae bacterium]|nr:DNA primase [Chitinophagaceae bacterium]MBK7679728.1 DNA primase [Chitinophagaceae bacterium]MBK9659900.1 DNA primase [Chitinophagaceae bacterium]MBK9938052.1 DNA primase [Chitinophagaceae bacterium]MBP6233125.1 DNA primase [Chitinophagaceae bacterium]
MITQTTIQQILGRLDILDVIGGFVKLKKRGSNYLGLCPFHNEKTPSFTVSPAKELYKCFGCGKAGNTISFIMEHEKYSYVDALKWLANKYGIEIEETFQSNEQREQMQAAESLYIINAFAQQFFTTQLLETEEGQDIGLSYLKERGFREDIIKKFQIGYSPEQRDAFTKEAIAKQYNTELLLKTGLVANRNEQLMDNYRGRIIFPIHNHSGKVLGFGARILKSNDKAPKYINTPENEIYIKSKILYGSWFARQAIDKADECLLVEGYTDVVSLHQAGIENVVASGGTSLTPDQLRLIRKYSNNLTIIYDGDAAGVKAALRGLDLALEEGLNVKLVLIPDKEDPDSYVNKVGATDFREFIQKNKKDFILFQLEVALKDAGNDSVKKSEVVNRMAETISKINKAEDFTKQQDYIKHCSEILKIDEGGLHALVNKFIRDRISTQERKLPFEEAKQQEENAKQAEQTNYDDATFNLLFKDELQEREVARILLEYGIKKWDDTKLVAEHILEEMVDESLIDNTDVIRLIAAFKELLQQDRSTINKNYFIYHPDTKLSTLAVSLLNFPYEESDHWRREFSQATGYQKNLFEQSYEDFIKTIAPDNEEKLMRYLKMDEDKTNEGVDSAVNYLKLRKIKRMLLENQLDLEKQHTPEEFSMLHQTHEHLKKMEMELTKKMGAVILK